jgi:hypothetical protein
MKQDSQLPHKLLTTHSKEIEEIFRRAVRHALWQHKRLGQSVAVSRNGQVVMLPPEEIPVDDEKINHANTEN